MISQFKCIAPTVHLFFGVLHDFTTQKGCVGLIYATFILISHKNYKVSAHARSCTAPIAPANAPLPGTINSSSG